MLPRHRIIISVRGICALRTADRAENRTGQDRRNSTTTTPLNRFRLSGFTGTRVKMTDMPPASGAGSSSGGVDPGSESAGGVTEPSSTVSSLEEKQRKRRRGESGRVESEEDAEKKRLKKETLRPNYFVSIPITNSKISEGVADVQEAVLEKDPRLARIMIPIGTLHLTLLVTHLANQEQVDIAASALAHVEAGLEGLLGGRDLVLPFSGIGTFRNEVAFVELAPGGHTHTLAQLADLTRKAFEQKGLSAGDSRDFKPHLTFMKLSRAPKLRSQGVKKLDPELYSRFSQQCFGEERVVRLDLCSMLKKKTPGGYYHTEDSLYLSGKKGVEPDDAELQRISRKLVEEAVLKAVQQYKEESHHQNGGGPTEHDTPAAADNLNTNVVAMTTTDTNPSK